MTKQRWSKELLKGQRGQISYFLFIINQVRSFDREFSQDKNTRVPMEPRYALRKRTHPQLQQHAILFLIQKFEKLTIHEVSEKDLSKSLKESEDPMWITSPPLPFIN